MFIQKDIVAFVCDVSTLSFWSEHRGAWYVAMLIPVYIIFPLFYDWIEQGKEKWKLFFSLMCSVLIISLVAIFNESLYLHLTQVFSSILVYIIGYYYIKENSTKSGMILSIVCLSLYIIKSKTLLNDYSVISNTIWSLLGIPVLFFCAMIFDFIKIELIHRLFGFLGRHSLEIYLCNIFCIAAYEYFIEAGHICISNNKLTLVIYSAIVVLNICLSVFYRKISILIQNSINGR